MILVFGILSLVVCQLFGPFAWIMGNNDLAAIRAGRMDPEGEGMTQAGKICGIIGTVFLVISILIVCLYFVFFMVIIGAAASGGKMR
jgi:hypothetical protein